MLTHHGTPAKRHLNGVFAGGLMMARLQWYLDPPSSYQLKKKEKKNVVKVGPPPTKLAGSAHDETIEVENYYMSMLTIFGSSKKSCQSWTPSDKTFWIRAGYGQYFSSYNYHQSHVEDNLFHRFHLHSQCRHHTAKSLRYNLHHLYIETRRLDR